MALQGTLQGKGLTFAKLEQLDEIFEAPNPVECSLESREVILDSESDTSVMVVKDKEVCC